MAKDNVSRSYKFFIDAEAAGRPITLDDVAEAAGWKPKTVKTYPSKKWKPFLTANGDGTFRVNGVRALTEDEYHRHMSQVAEVSADPRRPALPREVELLLVKAQQAAILSVDVYNKPATLFRTEAFVVLQVIAWTSLFHAIFRRRGVDCTYKNADGSHEIIDGDPKQWELSKCVAEFFNHDRPGSRTNLEFMVKLRNKIEHRYVPAIDPMVAGECQAMLLNFEELMTSEFGDYYAVGHSLAVPLQTSKARTSGQLEALRELQGSAFDEVSKFIRAFRGSLADTTLDDPAFSFRVYLVPKSGNHRNSSDVSMEFVRLSPEEAKEMADRITVIRDRQVAVANVGMLRATDVVERVGSTVAGFNMNVHTKAWKAYCVRKTDSIDCDTRYCQYDKPHKDYIYTEAWVELLREKLSDPLEFARIKRFKAPA